MSPKWVEKRTVQLQLSETRTIPKNTKLNLTTQKDKDFSRYIKSK